jgi:hypothetical protein
MKVKDLINNLTENFNSEDEIIVLFYGKEEFDDDGLLTDTAWLDVADEFNNQGGLHEAEHVLTEQIREAVSERYSNQTEDEEE